MVKNENFQVRTDLAVEAREMYVQDKEKEKQGIIVDERMDQGIKITDVYVNSIGEKKIGKKQGTYITIYADGVKKQDTKRQEEAAKVLAGEIEKLLKKNKISKKQTGLIVGLGNWQVTPDALGPMTTDKIMVTSHLFKLGERVEKGYRPVASVQPGVMGVTGIETSDIIYGIVEQFQPDFIIAIDALAARSIERVNETIQLTDTGIQPGSGVGNKRKELSKEVLGIPVFAIGVPTVVDAVTIASDTMDYILKHIGRKWKEGETLSDQLVPLGFSTLSKPYTNDDLPNKEQSSTVLGLIGNLEPEEKRRLITEVLTPMGQNLMVTPKEVDGFMIDMAHLLASGINSALHENISANESSAYTR